MAKKRPALSEKAKRIFMEEMRSAAKRMDLDVEEIIKATEEMLGPRKEDSQRLGLTRSAVEHKEAIAQKSANRVKKMRPKRGLKPYQLRALQRLDKPIRNLKRQIPQPDGPKIHILHPEGTVDSRVWTGRLEDKHPPFEDLGPLIDVDPCEVGYVRVLLNGKKMWMFVDDDGKMRSEYVRLNWKASAVYANQKLLILGATNFLYGDLSKTPELPMEVYAQNKLAIVGTVVLWEGGLE